MFDLRIFEATGASIDDLGEEHGHRVLRVQDKGDKVVLVPLSPAVTIGEEHGRPPNRSSIRSATSGRSARRCAAGRRLDADGAPGSSGLGMQPDDVAVAGVWSNRARHLVVVPATGRASAV
jgi:hypothetical protein